MKYLKSVLVFSVMVGSTAAASYMKPDKLISELRPHPALEVLIPQSFKGWKIDPNTAPLVVDASLEKTLNEIYSQTLSRTYVNARGERVMLSIAYGANQSRDLQLHRPEVCYSAQGFQVKNIAQESFRISNAGTIPSKNMVAQLGSRTEPITYWMRVGDKVVTTGVDQMMTRYGYGLRGYIPDGLLFRVSNISSDRAASVQLHERFVADLYDSVDAKNLSFLFGESAGLSTKHAGM